MTTTNERDADVTLRALARANGWYVTATGGRDLIWKRKGRAIDAFFDGYGRFRYATVCGPRYDDGRNVTYGEVIRELTR